MIHAVIQSIYLHPVRLGISQQEDCEFLFKEYCFHKFSSYGWLALLTVDMDMGSTAPSSALYLL